MGLWKAFRNVVSTVKSVLEGDEISEYTRRLSSEEQKTSTAGSNIINDKLANKVEQVRKEAEEKLSEFFNIVSDKVDDKKSKMNTQKEETSSVKCQTSKDFECKNVKCENKIKRLITFLPNFELLGHKNGGNVKYTIEEMLSKYCIIGINEKIKNMSEKEKAEFYSKIASAHEQIVLSNFCGYECKEPEIAAYYSEKCYELFPENFEYAQKLYEIYRLYRNREWKKEAKLAEKCLDLANNEQKIKYSQYYYESIAEYYRNETSDYEKAVENYKKAVKASEETGKVDCYLYRNMGYAYEANGDYKNAYDTYRFVESRNPETVNIIESIMRVEKYLSSEKTKEQIDEDNYISDAYYTFQSSSKTHKPDEILEAYKHYRHAEELIRKGDRHGCIREYKKVKEILPEETSRMNSMISMHLQIGKSQGEAGFSDNEELIELLKSRLNSARMNGSMRELASVYNSLAIAYGDANMDLKALEAYKEAIRYAPGFYPYYNNMALCYKRIGLYNEAIAIFEKILDEHPDFAKQCEAEKKIAGIKDIINGNAGSNGEDYTLAVKHCESGDKIFNEGDFKTARDEYIAAQNINEKNIDYKIREFIANQELEYTFYDEKEEIFNSQIICGKNNDYRFLPFIYTIYGDCNDSVNCGENNISFFYYKAAVDMLDIMPVSERFAAPYYKLGRLYEIQGEYITASEYIEKAKEIDSSYEIDDDMTRLIRLRKKEEDGLNTAKTVHVELGNKYFESAEYEKALIEYKKALERDPNDVMSLFQFCKTAEKTNSFYELKRASLWLFSRISKDYDSGNLRNDVLIFFGKCCQYELNFDKAECYYKEAIGDYSEDEFYRSAYEALIECYKEKGDKIALKHAERLYARFLD